MKNCRATSGCFLKKRTFLSLTAFLTVMAIPASQSAGLSICLRSSENISAQGRVPEEETSPVLSIGKTYLETRYVSGFLDKHPEERLVIQTDSVDCVTFVEYVLAQALDASSFAANLRRIRYRDGIIDGYPSRLHYASDWIENGIRQGFLQDITAAHCNHTVTLSLSYMSTHPELYIRLSDSPENIRRMREREKELSGKSVLVLPKGELPDTGLSWIKDGDIIAITTNAPGLDVAHMGIACYVGGRLYLLHASSSLGKVVISKRPLAYMLHNRKSWTGIRVVRMSHFKTL